MIIIVCRVLPEAAATAPEQVQKAHCLLPSSSEVKNFMHLAALGAEPARRFVLVRTDQREIGLPCWKEKKGKTKESKSLSV